MTDWRSIATLREDKRVLLWWIGVAGAAAPPDVTIGELSSYEPGKIWGDDIYRPVEWFTHWAPLPEGPLRAEGAQTARNVAIQRHTVQDTGPSPANEPGQKPVV